MTTFWIIALAIALVGSALIVVPLMRSFFGGHEGDRHPGITLGTGIAIALILPVAALTLYARWSSWDWAASGAQMSAQEAEQVHSMGEAITSLEARLAAQPDDLEGWQMLARSYMSQEQFGNAARAYQQAVGLAPDDLSLRADYAEALFLSDPAGPAGEAGMMFAELVEQTPENAKVMWYGGFVAFETGQDARGRELWSALLERNPPAPIRRIIEERLGTSSPMGDTLMGGAQAATPESDETEVAVETRPQRRQRRLRRHAPPTDPDAIQLSVTRLARIVEPSHPGCTAVYLCTRRQRRTAPGRRASGIERTAADHRDVRRECDDAGRTDLVRCRNCSWWPGSL